MFRFESNIKLPDTDAAGMLFFGNCFKLAHDAYEAFLDSIGFSLAWIIPKADFLLLIAHAEADYEKPMRLGERLTVELTVEKIGQTSFVLAYSLKNAQQDVTATVRTVHVRVDKVTGEKIPLPDKLREKLADVR